MSDAIWYFVWPWREIRSTAQFCGAIANLLLQLLMAWHRWFVADHIDSFGWLPEKAWLCFGLFAVGYQVAMIERYIYEGGEKP